MRQDMHPLLPARLHLPNSITSWGPNIQTCDPVGDTAHPSLSTQNPCASNPGYKELTPGEDANEGLCKERTEVRTRSKKL